MREYIARNIYTKITLLTAKYNTPTPELAERAEKTILKLRKTAKQR